MTGAANIPMIHRMPTVLSDFVPRGIAAVEQTIAEPGLLQQYGRIK